MSLSITSDAFIWTMRVLLVVVVVGVLWGWPRLAPQRVVPILGRIVALTLVSLLGVVNVLAPVNAAYGWYMTVGDLMPGADAQTGTAVLKGGAPRPPSTPRSPPPRSSPGLARGPPGSSASRRQPSAATRTSRSTGRPAG